MDERYYVGVTVTDTADPNTLQDAALRRAVERAPFSAPEQDVEEEYKLLLAELRHRLTYESMAGGTPLYQRGDVAEQMEALRDEAVFQVKARLVLDDVICREALSVSAQELEAEGLAIAQRQGMTLEQVRDFLGSDLGMVKRDLLERKALDFITGHMSK